MAEEKKRGPGRPKGSKNKNSGNRTESAKKRKSSEEQRQEILEMQEQRRAHKKLMDEIWAVTIFAIGVFLVITTQFNTTGAFGDAVHDILRGLFGVMTYVLPYVMMVFAVCLFVQRMQHINTKTVSFSLLIFIMLCVLNSARFIDPKHPAFALTDIGRYYSESLKGRGAGAIGMEIGNILVKFIGMPGLYILAITVIIVSLLFVVDTPISKQLAAVRDKREENRLLREQERELELAAAPAASTSLEKEVIPLEYLSGTSGDQKAIDTVARSHRDIKNKKQILQYMNDDSTLRDGEGRSAAPGAMGLEQVKDPEPGKGLGARLTAFADNLRSKKTGLPEEHTSGLNGSSAVPEVEQSDIPSFLRPETAGKSDDDWKKSSSGSASGSSSGKGLEIIGGSTGLDGGSSSSGTPGKGLGLDGAAAPDATGGGAAAAAGMAAGALARDDSPKLKTRAEAATEADKEQIEREIEASKGKHSNYVLPPVDLLTRPKGPSHSLSDKELADKARLLEETLQNFNVDAHVIRVTQGASVTRYEVQPAVGVKVSSIVRLSDDIALNLRAKSIRIEAPIPGKAAVGIEVENARPATVLVRELIDSDEFRKAKSKISFAVGKDISGNNIVADLKEMPHLLIAGATGSGKSVCINTMIASILYKATPDEVKLVLIDPKVVELGVYNDIPHMLIPVVTDPKKAAAALNWAVNEMNNRYHSFAENGVRDLESYNEKMAGKGQEDKVLPQVVIIIDELADLMMTASSQVEEAIMRLAQKARAAGMHLVVATQRPSVDVVTGVIKANIPSRIALSVSSSFDSRTILDTGGAEKLLGKGDMLFSPVNLNKPVRIQGPYISDKEISRLVEYVKEQGGSVEYNHEVIDTIESPESAGTAEASDELTEEAIQFILHQKQASVSMLQRRFRIGYNRAARIVDEIEARGIIGPSDGSRPRQVLMTEDEYNMRMSGGEQSSLTDVVDEEKDLDDASEAIDGSREVGEEANEQ